MIFIIILFLICYCLFFIWLTEGLRKSTYSQETNLNELPSVSIIIAARNEKKNLPNLLDSLSQLTYPINNLEIIIVNDRSNDNTSQILNSAKDKILNLCVLNIKETPLGWAPKKWALQQAINKSKNEILLQTDADCQFNPNWVETMVESFLDPTIGFVAGPAPIRYKNQFYDQFAIMDSVSIDAVSAATIKHGIPLSCNGRNITYRRAAFLDINGYDGIQDQISGDDDLLMQKMTLSKKWRIEFICNEKAIVNSIGPNTMEEFIYQRLRFASKSLNYYKLETNITTRIILPLLYITNFFIVISMSIYLSTLNVLWLIPLLIKCAGDCLLTLTFFNQINIKWSLLSFIVLDIVHPFYVVIFGSIAPFHKIRWKN